MWTILWYSVVVGIFAGLFLTSQDVWISSKSIVLGEGAYDMTGLVAPVATGVFLQGLSALLTKIPLIRRKLLNDNNLENVRILASQVPYTPMYYPMHRAGKEEWEEARHLAEIAPKLTTIHDSPGTPKFRTVRDFAACYRNGSLTPTIVMTQALKAVKDFEKAGLNIFSSINEADVLAQAADSDKRFQSGSPLGIFDGVPVAFKDMLDVAGHSICNGKHPTKCVEILKDDILVTRFREVGAIIFGVTIMTEGGVTPLGYSAHYNGPHSAYSQRYYSGGSSSGSAVAVATGIVPVAIGFDGGGSIRIPASLSGIHGLGMTFGRVPFHNRTETTMIKAGPLVTNAYDAGLVYELLSPPEEGHFYSILYDGDNKGPPPPHVSGFTDIKDLSDVRLGVFDEWFNDADLEVVSACRSAINELIKRGATIVPISIPHLQWMSLSHGIKIASEFSLAFDEIYHSDWSILEPNTQVTIGIGKTVSALEVLSAEKIRAWTFHYMRDLYKTHNLTAIATPTVGVLPPPLSAEAKFCGENNNPLVIRMLKYIFLGNFIGMPGYSVPVGYTQPGDGEDYLPIGLHFMGTHWTEHKLLRLANAWDDIYAQSVRRPRQFFADVLARKITLAEYRRPKAGEEVSVLTDSEEQGEDILEGEQKIPLRFIQE